jgi:hypothetical protein
MDMAITTVVFVKFLTWATIHIPAGIAGETMVGEITAGVIMVGMETMVGVTTAGEITAGEITMVEILAEQQQEIISQVHAEM